MGSPLFLCFFLTFYFFSNTLLHALLVPLVAALSTQGTVIVTKITTSVFLPVTLAVDLAMVITAPFFLLQVWQFIAPGLYHHERYYFRLGLIMGGVLFGLGMLFCFYVVLPFMFYLFVKAVPPHVALFPDLSYAFDFITRMLLLFGLCFQVPLLCFILVRLGVVDHALLKTMRPYVIVFLFTLAMLLTPPDVFSQIILAIPLCLLYELGIFISRSMPQNKHQQGYKSNQDNPKHPHG